MLGMLKNNRAVRFTFSVASKRILPLLFDLPVYYGHLIWSNICETFLTQYILQIMVCLVVLVCNEVHRYVPNFVVLHPRKQ